MIVVASATGTVGREVIRELRRAGAHVAALVRDRERAIARLGEEIELREGDLARPETLKGVCRRRRARLPRGAARPGAGRAGGKRDRRRGGGQRAHVIKLSAAGAGERVARRNS